MRAVVPASVVFDQAATILRLERQARALIRTLRAEHLTTPDHDPFVCETCRLHAGATV